MLFFILQIIAFISLPSITNVLLFQALILIVVSCYGGGFSNLPAFIGDLFGVKQLGAIHGYMLTTWSMGGILGPLLVSQIYERTGSYIPVFYLFTGLILIAFAISLLIQQDIKRIKRQQAGDREQEAIDTRKPVEA
ncbi:MFS transporter [Alkalilimnicola ehrlichii]|nr:MFS transporter [Alkalilimnicola ehrlichii]